MAEDDSRTQHYRAAVIAMSQNEAWSLSPAQVERYVERIVAQVPAADFERYPDLIIGYVHRNSELLAALGNDQHPLNGESWHWAEQVIRQVIHFRGLNNIPDRSVELDDLIQLVQLEIARSLSSYRFNSSLNTWIQSITRRRLAKLYRDANAQKRPRAIYGLEHVERYHTAEGNPEAIAMPNMVIAYIRHLLEQHAKPRDAAIFHMYAIEDQSVVEIGKQVKLHPSRVRALLQQMRRLLQDDTAIRAWMSLYEESATGNEYSYNNNSRNTM